MDRGDWKRGVPALQLCHSGAGVKDTQNVNVVGKIGTVAPEGPPQWDQRTVIKHVLLLTTVLELSVFEHTSKSPSKCSIPKPNGYHQWIRAEVLPLESVLQV